MGGWVMTLQGKKPVLVGETRQNGVTIPTKGKGMSLTRDLLIQYGIPKVNSDSATVIAELCPKNSILRYIELREGSL